MADYSKIDLLVGPTGYHMQGPASSSSGDSFVAVADAGNPLLQQPQLTLADLAAVPHAVGYFGEGISTRRTSCSSPGASSAGWPPWWQDSCPCRCWSKGRTWWRWSRGCWRHGPNAGADIVVLEFSEGAEASLVEAMYWHPSQSEDPASVWLRSVVQRACSRLHDSSPSPPTR